MFKIFLSYFSMVGIILLSNYLVLFPINDWLTWGAFPYPFSFFISEMTNKFYGPQEARRVVGFGFFVAAFLSFLLATPLIAVASLSAFLVAQLLDISVFNQLRQSKWWVAPLWASVCGSMIDTAIFWTIAFWGDKSVPILTWALGDFSIKLLMDICLLVPFRYAVNAVQSNAALPQRSQ
jgi:uncharacterized PurR-regulated membrane protein YhhQ (DUF165 family)